MNIPPIDCSGLPCPQPVILVKKTLTEKQPQELTIIVDNAPALENVSRLLTTSQYIVSSHQEGDIWHITAKTDATYTASAIASPSSATAPTTEKMGKAAEELKTAVLILSPLLGEGDDDLGGRLMKNFLATLPELGDSLWRIIMLNGGVSLATKNSPVIAELQALEQNGVGILVCGTCLEHFNLLEQKSVGETTNMLDVVTSLQLADKVIRI